VPIIGDSKNADAAGVAYLSTLPSSTSLADAVARDYLAPSKQTARMHSTSRGAAGWHTAIKGVTFLGRMPIGCLPTGLALARAVTLRPALLSMATFLTSAGLQ